VPGAAGSGLDALPIQLLGGSARRQRDKLSKYRPEADGFR
jgi:hypothetical protein